MVLLGNTALGSTAATAGTVLSGGSTLLLSGGVTIGAELLTLTGTSLGGDDAITNVAGTSTWQGAITLLPSSSGDINSTLDVAQGQLTLSGAISGVNDLNKTGNGNLTLLANKHLHWSDERPAGRLEHRLGPGAGFFAGRDNGELGSGPHHRGGDHDQSRAPDAQRWWQPQRHRRHDQHRGAVRHVKMRPGPATSSSTPAPRSGGSPRSTITGNVSGADLTELGAVALTLTANSTFTGVTDIELGNFDA